MSEYHAVTTIETPGHIETISSIAPRFQPRDVHVKTKLYYTEEKPTTAKLDQKINICVVYWVILGIFRAAIATPMLNGYANEPKVFPKYVGRHSDDTSNTQHMNFRRFI